MFRALLYVLAWCAAGAPVVWAGSTTITVRVNTSTDDAWEDSGGSMKLTDSEIKLEDDNWAGLRFRNLSIPQGAYIISAYVTFRASASASPTTSTVIYGEDINDSSTFDSDEDDISDRSRTSASVSWSVPSWTSGQNYNTPGLKSVVQEIVSRSGWASGNDLSLLIETTNSGADRKFTTYNGNTSLAPLLTVEYVEVAVPVATRLLFVVGNSGSLTTQESTRKTMFEALGYTVTLLTASSAQGSYDTAAAANDVAYISEEVSASDVSTKLKSKSLGVVNEELGLADDFAISSSMANSSATAITIASNTHFITSAFSTGSLTITSSSQSLNTYSGTLASESSSLATLGGTASLVTAEAGAALTDSTKAAGRRVMMPWGGDAFDINALNADGIVLLSRALAWAGGLVSWWKLDETSGTTASDSSVNLRHSTLTNLSFSSDATTGKLSGALQFDGSADYASATNSSVFQLTKALSISAWIRGTSWGSGSFNNIILRKGETNANNWQLVVQDGHLALGLDTNDGFHVQGDTLLQTGVWYHVVGTWDGSNIRLYVNATLDDTPTARAAPINTDSRPIYLGGRSGTDNFHGVLDDVRLYNHALQLDEINTLKTQGQSTGLRIIKWVELP
jgi:hypothetical protein